MIKHLRFVDALRGVAASWVVLFHIWKRYYPELSTHSHAFQVPEILSWEFIVTFFTCQYGYIGVTLFFVLSGFCIHLPQAKKYLQTGRDQLVIKDFGKRRFWRLYPAYFASVVFTAIAAHGFYPILLGIIKHQPVDIVAVMDLKGAFYNAFFLQQLSPKTLFFNGVYWTLLFEVQFYIFYPALLWFMRRCGLGVVFCVLLGAEIGALFWKWPIDHFFITRYYEWFLGVLAAEWYVSGRCPIPSGVTALVGIFSGIGVTFIPLLWPYRDVLMATGFLGLLMYFICAEIAHGEKSFQLPKFLDVFVPIGLFSYSLYLVHIPIIDITWTGFKLAAKYGYISDGLANTLSLIAIPIAFIFAYQFYFIFEKPFLQFKKK